MILLVNHTLLSKKDWCEKAPNTEHRNHPGKTWREVAYEELDNYLLRKPFVSNEAAENGNKFENAVCLASREKQDNVKGSDHFKKVVNTIRGGQFQVFKTKDVKIDDITFRYYGILDVLFKAYIIDIKTTAKFKPANYRTGQDELYKWLTGLHSFSYLIAEWADDGFPKIEAVHTIDSIIESHEFLETKIMKRTAEFVQWMKDIGRYNLWRGCYSHLGKGWKNALNKSPEELQDFYKGWQDEWAPPQQVKKTVEDYGF